MVWWLCGGVREILGVISMVLVLCIFVCIGGAGGKARLDRSICGEVSYGLIETTAV